MKIINQLHPLDQLKQGFMNRFILLFLTVLFLYNGKTLAQNIEITVLNKNSIPMPYAFILINGKPITVSDTLGLGMIPINKLRDNDTISISYLGASVSKIIYDNTLKENKKHCFYLDESVFNLNEVVVKYQDIEKLFRKSTKRISVLQYNCKMNAKFDATLKYIGQPSHQVFGAIEATNDIKVKPNYWHWFDNPIKFTTNGDTTGFGRFMNPVTHMVLFYVNISLIISQSDYKNFKKKPFYTYLGEKDNCKLFRISYPPGYFAEFYYHILLYVDRDTRYIQKVEVDAFNDKPGENNYLFKFNLKYDCNLFTHKKPNMNTIYLADNIQFTYQAIDQFQYDLNISEITIK